MIDKIKRLFGIGPATDYDALMEEGGVIVDVRTTHEFRQGHIKGSVNIPLNNLKTDSKKLKKDQPVILCCASGIRSGQAKGMLKSTGFGKVYNGGGWMNLERKIGKG